MIIWFSTNARLEYVVNIQGHTFENKHWGIAVDLHTGA